MTTSVKSKKNFSADSSFRSGRMEYIAHRGASGYAPENTMAAFRLAMEMGMANFEFDLHLTRDGVLVVHHDYDFKSTAGLDIKIAGISYGELEKINAAARFKPAFPAQKVPRFEEVMSLICPSAGMVNVEIKNDGGIYPGIERALLKILHSKKEWAEKALISSFDFPTMERIRALDGNVRLGLLGSRFPLSHALKKAGQIGAVSMHFNRRLMFPGVVRKVHEAGMKCLVYTVNTAEEARKLEAMGVDGVFTNYPDIASPGWEKIGGTA